MDYDEYFYVISEYIGSDNIIDFVLEQPSISEKLLSSLLKQVLTGLQTLHSHNLVHGDIKVSNLIMHGGKTPVVKLRNLGVSALFKELDGRYSSQTGSRLYMAPELCEKKAYDAKCDIWSCGIVFFLMVFGHLPYNMERETLERLMIIIKKKSLALAVEEPENSGKISPGAKDFMKKMLEVNPEKRWTAEQLLGHEWLSQAQQDERALESVHDAMKALVKSSVISLSTHRPRATSRAWLPPISCTAQEWETVWRKCSRG